MFSLYLTKCGMFRQNIPWKHGTFDFSKAFDTVRHSTLIAKFAQLQMPDCIHNWICDFLDGYAHCTKYAGLILGQHCAHGVQHRQDGRRRLARRPKRELIGKVKTRARPQQRQIDVGTHDVSLEHAWQDRRDRNRPEVTRLRRRGYLGYGCYHSRFPLARHDTRGQRLVAVGRDGCILVVENLRR